MQDEKEFLISRIKELAFPIGSVAAIIFFSVHPVEANIGPPIAGFLIGMTFLVWYMERGRKELIRATREIEKGNLEYRITRIPRFGWIYLLGNRINNMADLLGQQRKEIARQQDIAESLLLNVLPAEVATELKAKGAVEPRYHEDVTVLFTDFKGFTLSTEKLAAEEFVKALHVYFTAFDNVVQQYGLEKLKTIGDSYMAVAGLPERRASHVVDAVLAAFAMIDEVLHAQDAGLPPWSVRIGVHTGPVISGVVGIRKFAFDIWGESVNFASRMESSGAPNRVNLSASTYARVKDFFDCEYRGQVKTKEGREFDMYFAVGLRHADDAVSTFKARYKAYFQRELRDLPARLTGKGVAGAPG